MIDPNHLSQYKHLRDISLDHLATIRPGYVNRDWISASLYQFPPYLLNPSAIRVLLSALHSVDMLQDLDDSFYSPGICPEEGVLLKLSSLPMQQAESLLVETGAAPTELIDALNLWKKTGANEMQFCFRDKSDSSVD